jgi:hypothetical protein
MPPSVCSWPRAAGLPGLLGQRLAPPFGQVGEQLAPGAAPQLEEHEGVFAEAITHQIKHRAHVFARVGLVGAAALAAHLLQLEGEQALAAGGKRPLDVLGHHAGQQLGRPARLLGEGVEHVAPVVVVEHVEPELHLVGVWVGALHAGMHPPTFKANGGDVAAAGILPGPLQPLLEAVGVDQLHPLLHPPGLLTQALIAELGGDGAVERGGGERHGANPR